MPVVEEAFETLRRSGLGPDARGALCAILDQVMCDFDRDGIQWAERLKYRALMDSLGAEEPIRSKVSLRKPARVLETAGAEGAPSLAAEISLQEEASSAAAPADPGNTAAPADVAAFAPLLKTYVSEAVTAALQPARSRELLSTRVKEFLEVKKAEKRDPKYIAEYETRIEAFLEVIGDKPIGAYTVDDMRRYRDLLDRTPVRAWQHFGTNNPVEAIRLNEQLKPARRIELMSPTNINAKYLAQIRTFFQYLKTSRLIAFNPVEGICSTRTSPDGAGASASEQRLPLSVFHLAVLRKNSETRSKVTPDYWAWRVLPRTGIRLDEFAQLTVFDIREINGRMCIDLQHFEEIDEDARHQDRRQELALKTENARRVIPLHPKLIEDGFLKFVESRRKRGGENARLFPSCTPDKYGCHSAALSKRLNREIDKVTLDPRYVAHSMRHTFAEACDRADVPEKVKIKFMGHAGARDDERKVRRSNRTSRRYGAPVISAEEMAWIDKLDL